MAGVVDIGGGDRLRAGRLEGDARRSPVSAAVKVVIGRQDGLGVAAGELHGTGVAGSDVAVGIQGRDGEVRRPRRP